MSISSKLISPIQIKVQNLDEEEQKILFYLEEKKPLLLPFFTTNIQKGRNGILNRFISSIIRENILGLKDTQIILYKWRKGWKAQTTLPTSIMDFLENKSDIYDSFHELTILSFKRQRVSLIVPVNGKFAFGRVEVSNPITLVSEEETTRWISHSVEILHLLVKEGWKGSSEAIEMFQNDLSNSSANLAFAYAYQNFKQSFLQDTLLKEAENHQYAYSIMEQSVIEGHPCHPGAKMRKGLTPIENYRYSAEFQNPIKISFVALHKTLASKVALNGDWNELLFSYEPDLKKTFENTLIELGKNSRDYYILPIHPWQIEKTIPTMFSSELHNKKLIEIPYDKSFYYAGMSFRTLFPLNMESFKPHYKLTTNVHLTGEVRTLSEQTIHNGPLMSQILTDILTNDPLIDERVFIPITELGGLHFYNELDSEPLKTERSENLACVVRENLYHYVEQNEIPIVGSALLSSNSDADPSVIIELINRYQETYQLGTHKEAAYSFFEQYVQNIIDGAITLLVKYGIGLEGHLQNTVPVFHKNGTPVKILIRDWEGIRVDKNRLSKAGLNLSKFHYKSRILTTNIKSVRNKAFYSLIQNHLGELVLHLSKNLKEVDEDVLWMIVKEKLNIIFNRIESEGVWKERVVEDRSIFFDKKIDYKAVTIMRMLGEAHEYTYVKVENPLSK